MPALIARGAHYQAPTYQAEMEATAGKTLANCATGRPGLWVLC